MDIRLLFFQKDKKLFNISKTLNINCGDGNDLSAVNVKNRGIIEKCVKRLPSTDNEPFGDGVSFEGCKRNESFQQKPFIVAETMHSKYKKHHSVLKTSMQWKLVQRCLFMTIIDLLMNLPSYLIRFYTLLASEETLEKLYEHSWFTNAETLAQLLYFAQFSLNAMYLYFIVYGSRPSKKKSINFSSNNDSIVVSKGAILHTTRKLTVDRDSLRLK
uniref:G_PROTEIN_RECEP_F1_2 domain-containing protein n=1 Tax=Rhabditophanes sp. KR3021 TaxID=114890 RepID=A0AC35TYR0_9BILA